jgi:hypothetical protein
MTRIQFDESPPAPRRWRFLLPAAVVAVASLLLWSSFRGQSDASTPAELSSSTVLGDRVWALANDASPHAPAAAPGADAEADAENMPCGENASGLPMDARSARAAEARWRAEALKIEASMIASRDEHVRAAGWFIRAGRAHIDARNDSESAPPDCKGRDCEQQLRDAAWARARAAALPAANQLAAMATSSQDAMVYATAMRACSLLGDKREGACSMVNAEQLARLDPENLWAWFEVVGAAGERRDSAAANDAVYRASLAKRADSYWGTVAALGLAAWPRGTSTMSKMFLTAQVATIEVMTGIGGGYQNLSKACAPEALAVAGRREQCDRIASTLVSRGSTMQDFAAGTGVGEQLGWPPERIAGLKKESSTLRAALAEAWIDAPGVCAGMRRFNEITRDVGRFGELGAARLALRRSVSADGAAAERRPAAAAGLRAAASSASAP